MGKTPDPQQIIADTDDMQAARAVFATNWQEVRDWVCPLGAMIVGSETQGAKGRQNVLDATGESAGDLLASAMVSMETPETDEIFELRTDDDRVNKNRAVGIWFEEVAQRMHNVMRSPRTGYQQTQQQKKIDEVYYGTAGGFINPHLQRGIVNVSVPLKQLLLAEDENGFINKVHRDWELEARQAAQVPEWAGALPAKIMECAADPKRARTRFRFIHAVCPRRERDYQSAHSRDMEFASTYVSVEGKAILRDSGYQEMPYQTPRVNRRGDETYGRGPGMKAVGDIKSLQRLWRITLRGGEKRIDPPLMASDDGISSPIRTNSSGITYYRAGTWNQDPIRALQTGGDPMIGERFIELIRTQVEGRFLKPLLQMLRQDRMTATEVLKVDEEQQRLLGPFLARDKAEDLGPMIERTFWIMYRAGAFPPMPEILQNRELIIEYVAPAIRAQRVGKARGLSQFEEITGPMFQADESLADNFDRDLMVRDTADALGLPKTWTRDPAQVIDMRKARQEVQQATAAREAMMQAAEAGAKVAGALPKLKEATGGELAA